MPRPSRLPLASVVLGALGAAFAVTGAPACSSEVPAPTPVPLAPGAGCPAPTGGPTLHAGDVKGDETWTAANSPHVLTANVNVVSGGKVTIEPCAEVRVTAGVHLNVATNAATAADGVGTGTLVAEGTADRPITFAGNDGARWASLRVAAPGRVRLAHVTLEGGGGDDFDDFATLRATGDGEGPADPLLALDTVTVKGSLGPGVWMANDATFEKGSKALTVTASGSGSGKPFAARITEHAIDAFPSGSYTGNAKDAILLVRAGTGEDGSGLVADATLHDRGVPYHFGETPGEALIVGAGRPGSLATLTIEAGVVLAFRPETALKVQAFGSDEPATGALRALGTAERPVVFTSAAPSPAPGDWTGLVFNGRLRDTNELDHVRIEYAGGWCSCSLVSCSDVSSYEAAIVLMGSPETSASFLTSSVVTKSKGHGITQGFDGPFVDFRPTNTFDAVAGCVQTLPRNRDTSCPTDPKPACDGR